MGQCLISTIFEGIGFGCKLEKKGNKSNLRTRLLLTELNLLCYFITSKLLFYLGDCNKSKWVASFFSVWEYKNYLGKQTSTLTITITSLEASANTFKGEVEQTNSGTPYFRITGTIKEDCTGTINLAPYGPVAPFSFDSVNCKFTFMGQEYSGRRLPGKPCWNHTFMGQEYSGRRLPGKPCWNHTFDYLPGNLNLHVSDLTNNFPNTFKKFNKFVNFFIVSKFSKCRVISKISEKSSADHWKLHQEKYRKFT